MNNKRITRFMPAAVFLLQLAVPEVAGSGNPYVIPRLVAGEIGGTVFTPKLSFKNLSRRKCEGTFELLQGDFTPAKGLFEIEGTWMDQGTLTVVLEAGEGFSGKLKKSDAGGFVGFGFWRQKGDCTSGQDLALTADMEVGRKGTDDRYYIVDQIGFTASATPYERWGFAARRNQGPEVIDATAFAVVPSGAGEYHWTVDFYHESGIGRLTREGTAEGPLSLFVHEVFDQDLPRDFAGYVTISADRPLNLEALTVAWGPGVQGGFQYSNFPVQADVVVPHTHEVSSQVLQGVIDQVVSGYSAVGISGAVVVHGDVIWTGASGNSFPGTPVTTDMYFDIGSIAKSYLAALILKLSEEGALSLQDTLNEWLPKYKNIDPTITIRQLLNHTSGVFNFTRHPYFWSDVFRNPSRKWTPEQVLGYALEPDFEPGTFWTYSNTNYTLLGMIAEKAAGSSLSEALRSRLLEPLGLEHTFLEAEEGVPGVLAHGWFDINGDGKYEDIGDIDRTSQVSASWGGGGMVATAVDVAQWACALFEGKVLGADSLSQMLDFREVSNPPIPFMVGYGLGTLKAEVAGREVIGHGGDMLGYTAMMFYLPQERITFSFLLNQDFLDFEAGKELIEPIISAIRPASGN
ncbi:MAG: beta-lactamase family protein [Acidobacteriota bacterium]|nr:MAG: beta-lactamase family protein [Acidobacteriota bacterium]